MTERAASIDVTGTVARVLNPDLATLRVPRPDGPGAEPAIHAANERARQAALAQLDAWFPSVGFPVIPQTTDATTFHAGRAADGLIGHLDPERLLANLLSRRSLQPPQLRLARDGVDGDPDTVLERRAPEPMGKVSVRPAVLARMMHEGYTVVLDGVDLRDFHSTRMVETFERALSTPVTINGYLSFRPNTSFGAHWDTQEVLILQLLGRKDWTVHQPGALSMTTTSHHRDFRGAPVWQGRIGVGDVLYVPRGWAHSVSSIEELSYHYTITIPRLNGVDTLHHVLGETNARSTRPDEVLRAPMQAGITRWPDPFDPSEHDAVDALVANRVARRAMSVIARPTQRLSSLRRVLADPGRMIHVRFPYGGGWVLSDSPAADTVVLSAGQKQFRVTSAVLPRLLGWSDGLVHEVSAGPDGELARHLLRLDILEVVDDPSAWPFRVAAS